MNLLYIVMAVNECFILIRYAVNWITVEVYCATRHADVELLFVL